MARHLGGQEGRTASCLVWVKRSYTRRDRCWQEANALFDSFGVGAYREMTPMSLAPTAARNLLTRGLEALRWRRAFASAAEDDEAVKLLQAMRDIEPELKRGKARATQLQGQPSQPAAQLIPTAGLVFLAGITTTNALSSWIRSMDDTVLGQELDRDQTLRLLAVNLAWELGCLERVTRLNNIEMTGLRAALWPPLSIALQKWFRDAGFSSGEGEASLQLADQASMYLQEVIERASLDFEQGAPEVIAKSQDFIRQQAPALPALEEALTGGWRVTDLAAQPLLWRALGQADG